VWNAAVGRGFQEVEEPGFRRLRGRRGIADVGPVQVEDVAGEDEFIGFRRRCLDCLETSFAP